MCSRGAVAEARNSLQNGAGRDPVRQPHCLLPGRVDRAQQPRLSTRAPISPALLLRPLVSAIPAATAMIVRRPSSTRAVANMTCSADHDWPPSFPNIFLSLLRCAALSSSLVHSSVSFYFLYTLFPCIFVPCFVCRFSLSPFVRMSRSVPYLYSIAHQFSSNSF